MVKQPACAAAINSSGFVPGPFSNRDVNEYAVLFRTPPGADNVPFPCFRSPFQTADAVRFIMFLSFLATNCIECGRVGQSKMRCGLNSAPFGRRQLTFLEIRP